MSKRTFVDFCIFEVEATTNAPCGGDSGHGGRTVVRITNHECTDMYDSWMDYDKTGDVRGIVLSFGGDAEACMLADALIWAGQKLHHQMEDNAQELREFTEQARDVN